MRPLIGRRSSLGARIVAPVIALLAAVQPCIASDLQIAVLDASGQPLPNVTLIAIPVAAPVRGSNGITPAIMDQIDKEFVPEVLIVRTGTPVLFPNSDSIAHQVYSFSPTKRFALPLYRGRQYPPVIFDQPGVVTLGCNIHDHMVGYVVVTDSPYFAQSDARGNAALHALPVGAYRVSAWHPRFGESIADQSIALTESQVTTVTFRLTKPLRPSRRANTDRRIRDY